MKSRLILLVLILFLAWIFSSREGPVDTSKLVDRWWFDRSIGREHRGPFKAYFFSTHSEDAGVSWQGGDTRKKIEYWKGEFKIDKSMLRVYWHHDEKWYKSAYKLEHGTFGDGGQYNVKLELKQDSRNEGKPSVYFSRI